ncbi:hypothetical protein R6Q59_030878 [Mikania micrantha]
MSSSGSTSTSSKSYAKSKLQCSCGAATCIRVSWTEANPGRRFICCVSVIHQLIRSLSSIIFLKKFDLINRKVIVDGLVGLIHQHAQGVKG